MADVLSAVAQRLAAQDAGRRWRGNSVGFAEHELGVALWSKQQEIIQAVDDYPRVAVASSHGVGKTWAAAVTAVSWLGTHENARVVTTAPTWQQVEQLLWREIRGLVASAHARGRGQMFPSPLLTRLEINPQRFAIGLSTSEPERFQGHHSENLLLVVDEASGVDDRIYEAAEGFLTSENAKVLLIGNPTSSDGMFYRAFSSDSSRWHTIRISTFDSPNYTGERVPAEVARMLPRKGWAEEMAQAWGEDSPLYKVRVMGEFASSGADVVVPLQWDLSANDRWRAVMDSGRGLGPVTSVGVDVGRGGDRTVIAPVHGDVVGELRRSGVADVMQVAGEVAGILRANPDARAVIDVVGIGAGVVDRLREQPEFKRRIVAFNAGAGSKWRDRSGELEALNLRAAAWWHMRELLDPSNGATLCLPPDDDLTADLTAPRFGMTSAGRLQIESKDQIRSRLGRSTDSADAVVMACWNARPGPGEVFLEYMRSELAAQAARQEPAVPELRSLPRFEPAAAPHACRCRPGVRRFFQGRCTVCQGVREGDS